MNRATTNAYSLSVDDLEGKTSLIICCTGLAVSELLVLADK